MRAGYLMAVIALVAGQQAIGPAGREVQPALAAGKVDDRFAQLSRPIEGEEGAGARARSFAQATVMMNHQGLTPERWQFCCRLRGPRGATWLARQGEARSTAARGRPG